MIQSGHAVIPSPCTFFTCNNCRYLWGTLWLLVNNFHSYGIMFYSWNTETVHTEVPQHSKTTYIPGAENMPKSLGFLLFVLFVKREIWKPDIYIAFTCRFFFRDVARALSNIYCLKSWKYMTGKKERWIGPKKKYWVNNTVFSTENTDYRGLN